MTISTTSFNERLARIEAHQRQCKGKVTLHIGEREVQVRSGSPIWEMKPQSRGGALVRNVLYPVSFVGAFVLGVISVVVSSAVRFHFAAVPTAEQLNAAGDSQMILGGIIAMIASMGFAMLFRLNSRVLTPAQSAGVLAGVSTLHNLAFWVPDLATQLFTPDWVALQQQIAMPDSLIFRGLIVPFGG